MKLRTTILAAILSLTLAAPGTSDAAPPGGAAQAAPAPQLLSAGGEGWEASAGIDDESGEFIAAWESYTAVCTRHCATSDFVLHTVRVARGRAAWQDSGPLTGADAAPHQARMLIDPAGHAAALYSVSRQQLLSINQATPDGPWSAPVAVLPAGLTMVTGLAVDPVGHAVVVFSGYDGSFTTHTEYATTR